MYSNALREHAVNPRNRREMKFPSAVGQASYARCGDKLALYFRIQDDVVTEVTFKSCACGPVIAAASIATTLLEGRTVGEARQLSVFDLHRALGGLPLSKRHAILLVLQCLHEALGRRPQPT